MPSDDSTELEQLPLGRPLGIIYVLGVGCMLLWLATPHSSSSDSTAVAVCAGFAVIVAVALVRGLKIHSSRVTLHIAVGAGTVLTTLVLYFVHVPGTGFALLYLWSTPYAFAYFSLRGALAHAAAAGIGLAVAIAASHPPGLPFATVSARWFLVIGTVVIVGLMVRRATQAAQQSDARFRWAFESSLNGMALIDLGGTITQANDALAEVLGRPISELAGMSIVEMAHREDQMHCRSNIENALAGQDAARFNKRFVRPDGTIVWARVSTALIRDTDGMPRYFVAQVQDVTGEHLARERLDARVREQEAIAALSAEALETTDASRLLQSGAHLICDMIEVGGVRLLNVPETPARAFRQLAGSGDFPGAMDDPVRSIDAVVLEGKDGPWAILAIYCDGGRVLSAEDVRFIQAAGQVMTAAVDRIAAEADMRHLALHDGLTGQPNRTLLIDRLDQALARAKRTGLGVALLMVDLDGFKNLNDSYGHDVGDELLRQLAPRLAASIRPSDTLARLGGDEFVVLCDDIGYAEQAMALAERLSLAWGKSFQLSRGEVFITASTGIAFSLAGTQTSASMLREADAAMYRAKERGPDRRELFDEVLRARAMQRLRVEGEFRRGLAREELVLHYQPCIDLKTGSWIGVEALLRWQHPERGLLAPADFIAIAEQSGLIVPAGRWVLAEATRQVAEWQNTVAGAANLALSVNVSARQLASGSFIDDVAAVLSESGLNQGTLGLEITESLLMDAESPRVVDGLRSLGAKLLLDDFGTGYSSLSYLKQLSLDVLKIDQSFVDGLGTEADDSAIVAAIVSLARTLGLSVVAEGVETAQQLAELRRLGCDAAQGYLFSRPVPAFEMKQLLIDRVAA